MACNQRRAIPTRETTPLHQPADELATVSRTSFLTTRPTPSNKHNARNAGWHTFAYRNSAPKLALTFAPPACNQRTKSTESPIQQHSVKEERVAAQPPAKLEPGGGRGPLQNIRIRFATSCVSRRVALTNAISGSLVRTCTRCPDTSNAGQGLSGNPA